MSGFLANFFNRRAAGQQQDNAPQANPAGQFDFLLSQYHSSVKGLGKRFFIKTFLAKLETLDPLQAKSFLSCFSHLFSHFSLQKPST
jgi:hypothetical protein